MEPFQFYESISVSQKVVAAADLTAGQLCTLAGTVSTAGIYGYPVHADVLTGENASLGLGGVATAKAGAAVAVGALLEVGTSGRVITRSAGVTVGRAITAAAADGDNILYTIIPN